MTRFSGITAESGTRQEIRNMAEEQNNRITERLKKLALSGRVSHAYIFEGGAEETAHAARLFAKYAGASEADTVLVQHEKPNLISVDDVRAEINQSVHIKPYDSEKKVYIVPEAQKMNVQAQNALLKTIEEPPEYVMILLLTVNAETFLETILSRCVLVNIYSEGGEGSEAETALFETVTGFLKKAGQAETKDAADFAAAMGKFKLYTDDALDLIRVWFRDVMVYKTRADINLLENRREARSIARMEGHVTFEGINRVLEAVDTARVRLNANVNYDLTWELLGLTICDEVRE